MEGRLEEVSLTCPYCWEEVTVLIESDVRGALVQDCEVCCNPWQVEVSRAGGELSVEVRRLED